VDEDRRQLQEGVRQTQEQGPLIGFGRANNTDSFRETEAMTQTLEEMEREADTLLSEIRKQQKVEPSQSKRLLKSFDNEAKRIGFGPLKTSGMFFKSVRDCYVNNGGTWQHHAGMKSYVEYMTKSLPSGMNEMQGADGGFLIPPEVSNQILMRTYENDLLSRCTTMPMTGNLLQIPAVNESSRANGSRFGGVQAFWRGEADSTTKTKPGFELVELKPESLSLYVTMTNEFMEDVSGVSIEQYLNLIAEQEFAFKIGDGIVNGSGTMQMQGLLNAAAKVSVAKETGQPGATIVAANVLKMWSRLHNSCRKNAIWIYDQSIEPALAQMTIGSAGSQLASYLPPGGLSDKPYGTLMGRPAIPVEFCQQLGTEGDLILWDPTTYLIGMRQAMQSASSMHVAFDTNEQRFRFIMRLTGRNWWISALTPKSGGPTQSCIVTLASRA
jgi:HK97 family phage major capsid protein